MSISYANTVFAEVVTRMENALDCCFENVSLVLNDATNIGGLAQTIGSKISVSTAACSLPRSSFEFILAHELVHVLQKRLSAPPANCSALEQEADKVAASVLAGKSALVCLADTAARPAFYEEFGHYYTSYYLMLAAGVDPLGAKTRAFFCQLPDEVIQFDACSAVRDTFESAPRERSVGKDRVHLAAAVGGHMLGIPRATPPSDFKYRPKTWFDYYKENKSGIPSQYEDPSAKARRLKLDKAAIQGLHALTGGDSKTETKFRIEALKSNWCDPVVSGLALHPLGDSFSHRNLSNPSKMYGSTIGHGLDGHDPDYVDLRQQLYLDGAKATYEAICQMTGCGRPFSSLVEKTLKDILASNPKGQSGHDAEALFRKGIKACLECYCGYDRSYVPEEHTGIYWSAFARKHAQRLKNFGVGDSAAVRDKIEKAGLAWLARRAKV